MSCLPVTSFSTLSRSPNRYIPTELIKGYLLDFSRSQVPHTSTQMFPIGTISTLSHPNLKSHNLYRWDRSSQWVPKKCLG
jgi:hypothetical protein